MTDSTTALSGLDIRPATTADCDAILDMWMTLQRLNDSYPPNAFGAPDEQAQREKLGTMLENSLDNEIALILVATLDDQPIGTLSIFLTERNGYQHPATGIVISVWVEPEHRRHGIASRLLAMARSWAQSQGAKSLQVGWHPANPKASGFWQAQGFSGYEMIGAMALEES